MQFFIDKFDLSVSNEGKQPLCSRINKKVQISGKKRFKVRFFFGGLVIIVDG